MGKKILHFLVLEALCVASVLGQPNPSTRASRTLDLMNNELGSYTGSANIYIDLYDIQVDGLAVPIRITYNSSGIKVNEQASWVGLGWDLVVGGSITESVFGSIFDEDESDNRNHPVFDFEGKGVAGTYGAYHTNISFDGTCRPDFNGVPSYLNGEEVNIFSYNFLGYSGKFYWDSFAQDFRFLGRQNGHMAITGARTGAPYGDWASFTIRTANGMKFTFKRDVRVQEVTGWWGPQFGYPSGLFHISAIELPNGKEIKFNYMGPYFSKSWSFSQSIRGNFSHSRAASNNNFPETYTSVLSQIITPYETITFQRGLRQDVPRSDDGTILGVPRLTKIEVRENLSNQVTKSMIFDNDQYFSSPGTGWLNRRLKLASISVPENPFENYVFRYNNRKLPGKTSRAVDHWGYYNGEQANQNFYPRYKDFADGTRGDPNVIGNMADTDFPRDLINSETTLTANANRGADEKFMKACILEKIVYGNGGPDRGWVKKFEYEANRFDNYTLYSADYINGTAPLENYSIGGGLRIKSIRYEFNEAEGSGFQQVDFDYQDRDGSTSGVLMNRIHYVSREPVFKLEPHDYYYTMYGHTVYNTVFAPLVGYRRVITSNRKFRFDNTTGEYIPLSEDDGEIIREFSCQEPALVHAQDHPNFDQVDDWLPAFELPTNGLLQKTQARDQGRTLLSETIYDYEVADLGSNNSVAVKNTSWGASCPEDYNYLGYVRMRVGYYPLDTWRIFNVRESTTTYDLQYNPVTITVNKDYETNGLLRSMTTEGSDGSVDSTTYKYVLDPNALFTNPPLGSRAATVKASMGHYRTRRHTLLERSTYRDGIVLSRARTDFESANLTLGDGSTKIFFYPKTTWSAKGGQPLRKTSEVSTIDPHTGAILESSSGRASAHVSTRLFSYDNSRVVAELPYSSFSNAAAALGVSYSTFKNYTDEAAISAALATLRTNLGAHTPVTTQLYDTRYGVKRTTSANGETHSYTYDQTGRLSVIRDKDGNITSRTRYNAGGVKKMPATFSISGQRDVGKPLQFAWTGTPFEFARNLQFSWDFGDGNTSTSGPNVQHTYQQAGQYTIRLGVRATGASWNFTTQSVNVDVLDPWICITDGPYALNVYNNTFYMASACAPANTTALNPTFTVEPRGGCPPITYQWYHKHPGDTEWTLVPGATSNSYTFIFPEFPMSPSGDPLAYSLSYYVKCVTRDNCGYEIPAYLECHQMYIVE